MKITHEYINSFGALIAILVAFSSVVERTPAIPIINVQTYPGVNPVIVERLGSQFSLTTNHRGVIRILNTNRQKAHISLRYRAADDCQSNQAEELQSVFGEMLNLYSMSSAPVAFLTDTKSYSESHELLPEQLLDIPWDMNVKRLPEKSGKLCVIISTLLADGSQFSLPYEVGTFTNVYHMGGAEFLQDFARAALTNAKILEDGKPTELTEDEVDYLLTAGDDPDLRAMFYREDLKYVAVPERTCFSLFAWRWCKIGSYTSQSSN